MSRSLFPISDHLEASIFIHLGAAQPSRPGEATTGDRARTGRCSALAELMPTAELLLKLFSWHARFCKRWTWLTAN